MPELSGERLLTWHQVILRSARSFRSPEGGDLVSVGWLSALARGNTRGVRTAQAAYLAAMRG